MRFRLIVFLAFLVAAAVAKLEDGWDQLEDMLKTEDEQEKSQQIHRGSNPSDDHAKNPCEKHHCGWGKECLVNDKNMPHCECIRRCPEPEAGFDNQVCSNQNETFPTLCHLYRERCICRRNSENCKNDEHQKAHLQYLGKCKVLEECTEDHLAQFPERMADWLFHVMEDLKKREELGEDRWVKWAEDAEHDEHLRHVLPVMWKFCELDVKPHDKGVTPHELIPLTAPVIPMESCINPFLKRCDADNDGLITLKEWGKCLGLKEAEIIEKC